MRSAAMKCTCASGQPRLSGTALAARLPSNGRREAAGWARWLVSSADGGGAGAAQLPPSRAQQAASYRGVHEEAAGAAAGVAPPLADKVPAAAGSGSRHQAARPTGTVALALFCNSAQLRLPAAPRLAAVRAVRRPSWTAPPPGCSSGTPQGREDKRQARPAGQGSSAGPRTCCARPWAGPRPGPA
jgi:hypothetical protein